MLGTARFQKAQPQIPNLSKKRQDLSTAPLCETPPPPEMKSQNTKSISAAPSLSHTNTPTVRKVSARSKMQSAPARARTDSFRGFPLAAFVWRRLPTAKAVPPRQFRECPFSTRALRRRPTPQTQAERISPRESRPSFTRHRRVHDRYQRHVVDPHDAPQQNLQQLRFWASFKISIHRRPRVRAHKVRREHLHFLRMSRIDNFKSDADVSGYSRRSHISKKAIPAARHGRHIRVDILEIYVGAPIKCDSQRSSSRMRDSAVEIVRSTANRQLAPVESAIHKIALESAVKYQRAANGRFVMPAALLQRLFPNSLCFAHAILADQIIH